VPGVGLEPTLHFWNQILSLERLPFRQPGDLVKRLTNRAAMNEASLNVRDVATRTADEKRRESEQMET
jgi:hypothetical protein